MRPAAAVSGPRVVTDAVATSWDESRNVPRFLWATGPQLAPRAATTPATAARAHLERHAPAYGLAPEKLAVLEPVAVHDTGRGGIIVTLKQRPYGLEVYHGDVKVLMRRNLELMAVSGSPLRPPAAKPSFTLTAAEALAGALSVHYGVAVPPEALAVTGTSPGGYTRLGLTNEVPVADGSLRFTDPARVKQVLFPTKAGALVPAYFVELFAATRATTTSDAFRYVVAAADGRVLERHNLTSTWDFRVWADGSGRPLDGPQADFTPHPTGQPDGSEPTFVLPSLVTQNGFNTNPSGTSDPWLAPGATETTGNNADAYADLSAPDRFSTGDLRATTTAADTFDRTYDTALDPGANADQRMASVTQIFYTANWLHDWYYDSGFDEAAGNAQADNFGRGGVGSDPLLLEVQDYGGVNNSDMMTPEDGASPRMQAYLWASPDAQRSVQVTPPGSTLTTTGVAGFGPQSFDVTGTVVLVDDGTAPVTDACEPITNDVTGKVALLDRGTCTFKQKAVYAEQAGAIGVILVNNTTANPPSMPDADPQGVVTIPMMSILQTDGEAIKASLQQGTVTAHLVRVPGEARDGALDDTVVAHEWGHYLNGRLAPACSTSMCAAMGEGWGDFVAMHLALRDGDDLMGTYAAAIYASGFMGDAYFGIRRVPYSIDFAKNAMTFRHIQDGEPLPTTHPIYDNDISNAESHNAGEVWAEMLFEAYVALLEETQGTSPTRTFDEARRAMSDYAVAGLKLQPPDATFTEARDAILAAARAQDPDDAATLADAFARRGAGSCAESPPRDSDYLTPVVESYEVKPMVAIGTITLDDGAASCDEDGVLDGGERGTLTIPIANPTFVPLSDGATLTVTSPTAGISFPAGATADVSALAAFGETTVTVEVALDAGSTTMQPLDFAVTVEAAGACSPTVTRYPTFRANYDDRPGVSASDDVESDAPAWTAGGDGAEDVWARVETELGNHVWHGVDFSGPSDCWLESPALEVSATDNFVMTFHHRHEFEQVPSTSRGDRLCDGSRSTTGPGNCDGAVIEISADDGATWEDIATYADPGYEGTTDSTADNPLGDRSGYVYYNDSWPNMDEVTLDLGTAFAGQTVRVRFHVASDMGVGAAGWDIDDLAFQGIDNTPFSQLVQSAPACEAPADGGSVQDDGGSVHTGGGDSGGCGCAVGAARRGGTLLGLLLVAAALLLGRRERRGARR